MARKHIACGVICLAAVGACLLWRLTTCGTPAYLQEVPLAGKLLRDAFGVGTGRLYPDGVLAMREVLGSAHRPASTVASLMASPILRGDYYSPSGRRVSVIRNACGVRTLFYENGNVKSVAVYLNATNCILQVDWYSDGQVRRSVNLSPIGTGWDVKYNPDGATAYRLEYLSGQATATERAPEPE
jgi:hypothetical protein